MSILIYFCLSKIRNPSKSSKILLPQKKKEKEKDLIFRMMTEVLWSSAGTSFTTQFLKILETPAFKITCLHNVIICVWKRKPKCLLEHRRPFFPILIHLFDYSKKKKENWIFMGPLLGFENVTTTPLCPLNEPTRSGKKSVNCIFKAKDWL